PAPGGPPLMMAPNPAAAAPPQDFGLPPVAPAQMTPERQRNFVVRQGTLIVKSLKATGEVNMIIERPVEPDAVTAMEKVPPKPTMGIRGVAPS
ncbi:hypothetical protein TELCIR_10014, partial [Teladorsagia circumcincta]